MSSRFKKVSLALYLDPTQSAADHHAYQTMLGWSNRRKALAVDSAAAMELHQLVHIHKDIYLSGLYLHDLKPELAKSVAAALAQDSVSSATLLDILKAHQIQAQPSDDSDLAEKLEDAVTRALKQGLTHQPESAQSDAPAAAQFEAIAQQLATLVKQQQQIADLKQLVAQQNRLIAELSRKLDDAPSTAPRVSRENKPATVEQRLESVKRAKSKGLF